MAKYFIKCRTLSLTPKFCLPRFQRKKKKMHTKKASNNKKSMNVAEYLAELHYVYRTTQINPIPSPSLCPSVSGFY